MSCRSERGLRIFLWEADAGRRSSFSEKKKKVGAGKELGGEKCTGERKSYFVLKGVPPAAKEKKRKIIDQF